MKASTLPNALRKVLTLLLVVVVIVSSIPVYAADMSENGIATDDERFLELEEWLAGTLLGEGVYTATGGSISASAMSAGIQSLGNLSYGSNGKFMAPISAPDPDATPIYTAQDLWNVRNDLSGSYVLMNDIDLSTVNDGLWEPIGATESDAFTGTFDGQGHELRNMIVAGSREYCGLFGRVEDATIINVGLEEAHIRVSIYSPLMRTGYTGGLVGYSSSDIIIRNCYSSNGSISVTASDSSSFLYIGGICGYADTGSLYDCYNSSDIDFGNSNQDSRSSVGGLIGSTGLRFSIYNCYNMGNLVYSSPGTDIYQIIGGICGSFSSYESTFSIRNCFNAGNISTSALDCRIGGICGYYFPSFSSIENCYNMGNVKTEYPDSTTHAGGICGLSFSPAKNCYNMGDVTSLSLWSWIGGISGLFSTDRTITNCYNVGNLSIPSLGSVELGTEAYMGGICGASYSTTRDCYWNMESKQVVDGIDRSSDAKLGIGVMWGNGTDDSVPLSTTEMKDRLNFALNYSGFDFANTWCFVSGDNSDYPVLRAFYSEVTSIDVVEMSVVKDIGSIFTVETVAMPVGIYPLGTWHSSNPSVASVDSDNGLVTARGQGTAIITATSFDGKLSASCIVDVHDPSAPMVSIPNIVARAGQEITFPVTLTNNPGISNYGIVMQYDPAVFTYISSAVGNIITENFGDTNTDGLASNQVRFRANTSDGDTPDNDGTLFTVTLLVSEGLDEGTLPADSLAFSYTDSMFDGFTLVDDLLEFGITPGSVTIKNVFYGDVNGDGTTNGIDQTWMNRFFSGLLSETQKQQFRIANADVSGDGIFNGVDQTRMNRFFSGLDARELGQR